LVPVKKGREVSDILSEEIHTSKGSKYIHKPV
jgi:hypothetical protein